MKPEEHENWDKPREHTIEGELAGGWKEQGCDDFGAKEGPRGLRLGT